VRRTRRALSAAPVIPGEQGPSAAFRPAWPLLRHQPLGFESLIGASHALLGELKRSVLVTESETDIARALTLVNGAKTRAEEIAYILRDEILIGQYRTGERLPSERDLVARFKVNRGAVREATKILSELGLVSVQPGGARIVAVEEATLSILGPLLDLRAEVRPHLVIEFVEVFSALMALSSRLAMSQASSEERAQLLDILDRYDPNAEAGQIRNVMSDFMAASIDIHQNLVLRLIGNGLRSQLVGRLEAIESDQTLDRALISAMRNAIESNDANLLATTVIKHFDHAKLRLINLIDSSTSAETGFVRNDL